MRPAVILILVLVVFIAGIGYWGFHLTAGLGGLPAGGQGAILALALGALVMIGLFLLLMRRQHRRDRRGD
ncbi:hypothetical protein [Indioceanicola profundi]|uniref:hypothetical protein n=1 Tax=Indioceanicola profundi TaxID=2220096 RepID=UPI000E6A9C4D|nr:hypothetical protein [Indioceanicola profundi]